MLHIPVIRRLADCVHFLVAQHAFRPKPRLTAQVRRKVDRLLPPFLEVRNDLRIVRSVLRRVNLAVRRVGICNEFRFADFKPDGIIVALAANVPPLAVQRQRQHPALVVDHGVTGNTRLGLIPRIKKRHPIGQAKRR